MNTAIRDRIDCDKARLAQLASSNNDVFTAEHKEQPHTHP